MGITLNLDLEPSRELVAHASSERGRSVVTGRGASRIRRNDLPVYTRSLATMLSAGLPLEESLRSLEDQADSPPLRAVIRHLLVSVQGGSSLSQAMACCPTIFDDIYVNMLKTGEVSGRLAETLEQLAEYLEESAELSRQVRAAMMYPAIVASVAGLIAVGLMVFVVPAFERIYEDLGGNLPAPTQALINLSGFIRRHILASLLAVVAVKMGHKYTRRTPAGELLFDKLKLSLPIFGALFQKVALCRFATALSQMLGNGVPLLKAVDLGSYAVGNKALSAVALGAHAAIEQGEQLSDALRRSRYYPPLLVKLLATGEKTGTMDVMLERTATFYRSEVRATIRGLTGALEPMLIVTLGLTIGGMVVCMFIPIFQIHEIVSF